MPKELTPCECSKYEAVIADQLEANIESGDYEVFTTGCDKMATRSFAPGHDAKLKSFLIRYGSAEYEVARLEGGVRTTSDAVKLAQRFAFAHMVADGIARAADKAAKKRERAAKKAAPPEPKKVTAKVGRWLREGVIDGDEFVYADAKGNEKRTTKYAVQN